MLGYSSLARSFVPITSTVSRSDAAAISSACSIARGVSTMAQRDVWSGARWAAIASTRARTSSADETFGTTIPSGPAAQAAARSSACHSVSAPLTRMVTSRRPYAPDAAAAPAGSPRSRRVDLDRVVLLLQGRVDRGQLLGELDEHQALLERRVVLHLAVEHHRSRAV